MTEKRFTLAYEKGDWWAVRDGDITLWKEEVIGELNALHEENEKLKRQICNLEHTRDFCAECCERLEKENEQLKSEIREVRGAYEQLWMRSYDY